MSEAFDTAVAAVKKRLSGGAPDGRFKFNIPGEGVIIVEGSEVTTEDGPADVTVRADLQTFRSLIEGSLDPANAFMTGKIEVDGDMSTAMKLAQLLD
ncbi:MAG: SCP2 sterol-binding domain-containing protein [Paracoccaceae bacterium]